MSIKHSFDIKQFEIKIKYFEITSLSKFNFILNKLGLIAFEENKLISDSFLEFTNNKRNDLYKLLVYRFEELFDISLKKLEKNYHKNDQKFLEIKNSMEKMIQMKSKLKNAFLTTNIVVLPLFNLFFLSEDKTKLYEYNEEELNRIFKQKIKKKTIYVSYEKRLINKDSYTNSNIKEHKIIINKDFSSFNFAYFPQKKITNKEILDDLIKKHQQLTMNNLPPNLYDFLPEIYQIEDEEILFENLNQDYKIKNNLIISREEDFKSKKEIVKLFWKDEIFFIHKLFKYKGIVFVKTIEMTFNNFKRYEKNYLLIFNNIINNNIYQSWNLKFNLMFLKYAFSKEDLTFIKNNINFKIDIDRSLSLVPLMNQEKINFIDDKSFVLEEMYEKMIHKHSQEYYLYVLTFFPFLIKTMELKRKINLFHLIEIKTQNNLSQEDKKWFEKYKNDKNILKHQLFDLISSFSLYREKIIEEINQLKVKNIEIAKNEDEQQQNNFRKINLKLNKLEENKKICNFFVHFFNKEDNKFPKDLEVANKKFPGLKKLKIKIINYNEKDISSFTFDSNDLILVQAIKESIIKSK